MTNALDVLREQLLLTAREREYLDFPARELDDAGRLEARELLVRAALAGDHRAPLALGHVEAPEALRQTLFGLITSAPVRVRVEAGYAMRQALGGALQSALGDAIRDGSFDGHGLKRAIDLLLLEGAEPQVMALLAVTPSEPVRSAIIDALWRHKGLHNFPTVWWSGLGLLRRRLAQPAKSVREPVMPRFVRLLGSTPVVEGYVARADEPIPVPLRAAMNDLRKGTGPVVIDPGVTADPELGEALLVYAVEQVLDGTQPRALDYVVALSGAVHRDVLEWAARHPLPALADAGRAAIARLDAAPS